MKGLLHLLLMNFEPNHFYKESSPVTTVVMLTVFTVRAKPPAIFGLITLLEIHGPRTTSQGDNFSWGSDCTVTLCNNRRKALLQSATALHSLLQSANEGVLQSAISILLQSVIEVITKCDDYYKVRPYTRCLLRGESLPKSYENVPGFQQY